MQECGAGAAAIAIGERAAYARTIPALSDDSAPMVSGLPFDDFRHLVASLAGPDDGARREAAELNARSAAREGALGRAGEIAEWLAAWSGRRPGVLRPQVAIFAGTHGLSAHLADTDRNYVQDFVARCGSGDAPINQLCAAGDYGLKVFDLALDVPTADITTDAAFDERGCAATIAFGMEAVAGGGGLLVLAGQGGYAGRISACAVLAAVLGERFDRAFDAEGQPASQALDCHRGHLADPLEALRRVGGREMAALAGAIVAARTQQVPIILDGIAAIAAAAVVHRLNPAAIGHCVVADNGSSAEIAAVSALGLDPLLSFGMQGGDGSPGAMAAGLVQAAAHTHAAAGKLEVRTSGARKILN